MPTRPDVLSLKSTSVDILNAIRNNATANYRDYVPQANPSIDSIREIGAVIMDYVPLQNEFLNALVNRIGKVIISSKMYSNPWSAFKRGELNVGETIEEIFVNIAKPFNYDINTAEKEVFKRETPDVRAAFHTLNYKKFYKVTIQQEQLRQAFLSWDGITDLISRIVDSMYTGANYDEFISMKYMVAKSILDGAFYPVTIPEPNSQNAKAVVTAIKGLSNSWEFMSSEYNRAGVATFSNKNSQYLIVNAKFDALVGVEVLATAFNMDKTEFAGQRVLVDSFGNLDINRLNELYQGESWYTELSQAELDALDKVPGIIVDKDWFMILDNMSKFTNLYNPEGLYWNYWYHVWKTLSVSPFANAAIFVPGEPSVVSVSVTPDAATVMPGQSATLTANVETRNYAPKQVTWMSGDETVASVDVYGLVKVKDDATSGSSAVITATSVVDGTKSATATVTVG